jgi:hypothetical protein
MKLPILKDREFHYLSSFTASKNGEKYFSLPLQDKNIVYTFPPWDGFI